MGLGREQAVLKQRSGRTDEQAVEIYAEPLFLPGEKVRSLKHIKNDGTVPGRDIGEIVVRKGDVGYVRDIGTFLQQFYIYAVDWIDRGTIVGMRGKELASLDKPVPAPAPRCLSDRGQLVSAAKEASV